MFTDQVAHQARRLPLSGDREVVEEGEALEEGEVSGTGQEFQLLVEDIIEKVEVVVEEEQEKVFSQEWEEKPEEQGQEHPRTGASSGQAPLEAMEALAALQEELSSVNEKDPKAYLWLQRKDHQRRKCPLIREVPSSRASLALGPKPYPYCHFLGVSCLGGGEGTGTGGGVRVGALARQGGPGSWGLWVLQSPKTQCQQTLGISIPVPEQLTMGGSLWLASE